MSFQLSKIRPHLFAAALVFLPVWSVATAASCSNSSGPQRVALLELYTSEGCSSCPPADRWLSTLTANKSVPATLLPLAFHVDYWNDLGWVDPFSQAAFSARQRLESRRRGARFVVTPQLLLNGQPYQRPLFGENIATKARLINHAAARAVIRIDQTRSAGSIAARIDVRALDDEARNAEVFLALYENNLATSVTAGENRGARLKHDFVVRQLSAPLGMRNEGHLVHDYRVRLPDAWNADALHLAVFVQPPASGEVMQALSASCR